MSELEVEEDRFYVLRVERENRKETTIHNNMESPIERIRNHLKSGLDPERVDLMTVELREDKFEIKSVPWSIIAVGLVKE